MTIRKTKSGKWTVDVSNGFHPVTQKRIRIIRKGLKSKKEALELEQHIRVVELKEKQFDFVVTTDMLFDLLEEDDLKNGRKVSYTSTQRNNYERHIKPYFKNTNLNKLTYDHIFEFREYLKTKPKKQNENEVLSYNTINKVLILLKKIFDTGIRKSLIDKNPVKNLRKLPIRKPDIKFWSIEEFTRFRGLIRDDEISYDLFFVIAFFTGMRMGEILALNWNDINLLTNTIYVTKTVYLERDKDLKKIRIHDLRHSHASLLINQGEDYLVVKERLGHASITTTIDTYSHLYPSKQKTLANKLDDLF